MNLDSEVGRLMRKLLSATVQRHEVIAGNLANQNTPGYKRRELEFENLLQKELQRGTPDLLRVDAQVVVDEESEARPDGNNVDFEAEHAALRENQLRYQLYSTISRGRTNLIQAAIRGDR